MPVREPSELSDTELLELQFLLGKRDEFEMMSEEEEQIIRHRARLEASPAEFFREAWNVMEPGAKLVWSWHYDLIGEHLKNVFAGKTRRLIINVPPRSAKSSCVTVAWPAWCWTRKATAKFLTASYAADLSKDLSIKRRRLIESQWYQNLWGIQFARDTNRQDQYRNMQEGEMIATSVEATALGRGGDILILDDAFNSSEVRSETTRKTTHDWFVNTFSGRMNDKATGAIVVIEQRTHDDDMTGWLLRNEPGQWIHLDIPLEEEKNRIYVFPISKRKHERLVGDVLQPQRNPPEVVAALKVHSRNFATQYQQRPAPDSGIVFKREWWQYRKAPRDKYDVVVTSWDFAVEGKADSDYNVGVLLGKTGANIDVLDITRARLTFPEQQRALVRFANKHPYARKHLVEKKANGPAIIASLKNQVNGLIAVEPQGSKLQRYDAASPVCESLNVSLLEAEWNQDFVEECAIAPNGANDDQCFVAGTMIATPRGDVPIECVRIGDEVITPFGIGTVSNAGITGLSQVISNRGLTGTPGHKVFTHSEFVVLDALTQCSNVDNLSLCTLIRWRVLRLLLSMESSTDLWAGRDAIISASQVQTRVESVLKGCMLLFGSMLTAKSYRKATTFIIGILTLSITTLTTWSRYCAGRIANSIQQFMISRIWHASDLLRSLGTALKRAASGTASMVRAFCSSRSIPSAFGAKTSSSQSIRAHNTVAPSADITTVDHSATTIQSATVSSAEKSSPQSSNPTQEEPASSVALSVDGPTVVYNLSVQPDGVYYANGILVSNCDAFAQGIIYLCGRNYSYGLLGYAQKKNEEVAQAKEEFMERAKNVGKVDYPDNAKTCPKCTSRAVVRIGSTFRCNGCSHQWPAVDTTDLKNPAYDRGSALKK